MQKPRNFSLRCILAAICLPVGVLAQQATQQTSINSPDNAITLQLAVNSGKLIYSVVYNRQPVIESSVLGLTVNGKPVGEATSLGKMQRTKTTQTYAYRGVHSTAYNQYEQVKIAINGPVPFTIEARVFNEGVAFRYLVPNSDSATIEKDNTAFVLPAGSILWSQPNYKHYEGRYSRQLIDTVKAEQFIGPPATIVLPGDAGYAAITEGGLTDFGGMSLKTGGNRLLQANLTGITKKKGTIETPWRIIEIGKDLNTLVNCDIIANVSPAYDPQLFPRGYNTPWVKPGRSVWSWLAGRGPVTLENMKRFTDMAAQLGFEYNLVDEGWGRWKDSAHNRDQWDMMKELVDYAAAKGVKVWVWKAYPNRGGIPGIKDPEQRKAFFKKCKELGIVGLKVDFFDTEAQEIIDFYQAALKDAAAYQLMMDFHGANKPTGETRTWPNEMSREGIKGLESRPPWAKHNTVLPFTRYLAGHADYTPVHFGERLGEVSWAHQVATAVIFTSPFLCYGADPQSILNNPCKEMIQSIPPVWDETIVLPQSKIGELVVYARRKGTTWFLAAISSMPAATVNVDLAFLGKDRFKAYLVQDDKDKQAGVQITSNTATGTGQLALPLNANGGFVARFEKVGK